MVVILIVFLIIILVAILFVLERKDYFKPATRKSINEEEMVAKYFIPSLWQNGDNITTCQLFTFSNTPSYANMNSCLQNGTCIASDIETCQDDDQLYGKISSRVCRYGEYAVSSIKDYKGCILSDGSTTKINGYYEEYANACQLNDKTSNRCSGTLALLSLGMINAKNLHISRCIRATGATGATGVMNSLELAICDETERYNFYPTQLFRVIRSVYSNGFVESQAGSWFNLIHRPDLLLIAPYCIKNDVISVENVDYTQNLMLIKSGTLTPSNNFWYLTPYSQSTANALKLLERYSYIIDDNMRRHSMNHLSSLLNANDVLNKCGELNILEASQVSQLKFLCVVYSLYDTLINSKEGNLITAKQFDDVIEYAFRIPVNSEQQLIFVTDSQATLNRDYFLTRYSIIMKNDQVGMTLYSYYSSYASSTAPNSNDYDLNDNSSANIYYSTLSQHLIYLECLKSKFEYLDYNLIHLLKENSVI